MDDVINKCKVYSVHIHILYTHKLYIVVKFTVAMTGRSSPRLKELEVACKIGERVSVYMYCICISKEEREG